MNNLNRINYITNGYLSIVRKEVKRIFRIWIQTLVPPLISQGLYFVIFGGIIGSQLSSINGVSYIQYILPGLIMMAIITNSFMNTASTLVGAKFMKSVEEVIMSPVPKWVVILGYGTGGMLRGLINGFLVLAVSYFFIPFAIFNILLIICFSVFTSFLFSMAGFLNALFAKSFDQVNIIPTFILTPLTYFAGVFYDINRLPQFWVNASKLNPILYMVDGFRYSFYGFSNLNPILSFTVLGLSCLGLFLLNWRLLLIGYGLKQ